MKGELVSPLLCVITDVDDGDGAGWTVCVCGGGVRAFYFPAMKRPIV